MMVRSSFGARTRAMTRALDEDTNEPSRKGPREEEHVACSITAVLPPELLEKVLSCLTAGELAGPASRSCRLFRECVPAAAHIRLELLKLTYEGGGDVPLQLLHCLEREDAEAPALMERMQRLDFKRLMEVNPTVLRKHVDKLVVHLEKQSSYTQTDDDRDRAFHVLSRANVDPSWLMAHVKIIVAALQYKGPCGALCEMKRLPPAELEKHVEHVARHIFPELGYGSMVMYALDVLDRVPSPALARIREQLEQSMQQMAFSIWDAHVECVEKLLAKLID